MSLRKMIRFNYLMERVLAKQLKNDDLEYLALKQQWSNEFKDESLKDLSYRCKEEDPLFCRIYSK